VALCGRLVTADLTLSLASVRRWLKTAGGWKPAPRPVSGRPQVEVTAAWCDVSVSSPAMCWSASRPHRADDPTAYLPSVAAEGYGTAVADRDIFINLFMPTTVHIPDPLLKSVDRRAKALGISRNRLVVRALEQAVSVRSGWAPEFLQRLRHVDRDTSAAVDELLVAVKQARRSKEPRDL